MVAIIAARIIAVVWEEELKCYEQIQRLYDSYGWTSRKYFPGLQVGGFLWCRSLFRQQIYVPEAAFAPLMAESWQALF